MEDEDQRVYNFSPGPGVLPLEVLKKAQAEMLNWHGSGMSVMEMSHRSAEFTEIVTQTEADLRKLLDIPENYKVFFLQGGASLQFTMIPKNLLGKNPKANYLVTGSWSNNAWNEAKKLGDINVVIDPLPNFASVPDISEWNIVEDASYFYFCDNETMTGVEFNNFPYDKLKNQTIVWDMSSNFATRKIDWSLYGVVFAGAHKNIGPAGVTITIVREDLLGEYEQEDTTNMLSWNTCAKAVKHLYNTPCSWSIYMCGLSIAYMLEKGMDTIEKEAIAKAELFYSYIDSTEGYYSNPVAKEFRSKVNIPFRVKDDADMEKKFVKEARAAGFIELAGHVTIGFCRASIYNAMPIEAIEKLVEFMQKFREENP